MKKKNIIIIVLFVIVIFYLLKWFFTGIDLIKIGTLYFPNQNNTYIVIYHEDKLDSYHRLLIDFYQNGSLTSSKLHFNYTDDYPDLNDFKLFECSKNYYLTFKNNTDVNVIWDRNLNILFPVNWLSVSDEEIIRLRLKSDLNELRRCNPKLTLINEDF